jgi:hypothetical protein
LAKLKWTKTTTTTTSDQIKKFLKKHWVFSGSDIIYIFYFVVCSYQDVLVMLVLVDIVHIAHRNNLVKDFRVLNTFVNSAGTLDSESKYPGVEI